MRGEGNMMDLCHGASLVVLAPSPQRALITEDKTLNCTFSVEKQLLNLNFLAVRWTFQGRVILRYDKTGVSSKDPRIYFSKEALGHGDASIRVSNVTISDGGIYKCLVTYTPDEKETEISLEVQAKPSAPIPKTSVKENTENTLTCMATGFFPPDIGITWLREGEVLANQLMGKPEKNSDGTYQVTSTVTITPNGDEEQNRIYSCRIQHASLQHPMQEDFKLSYEEESSTVPIVAGIVVVAFIGIVAAVIFIIMQKRLKSKKAMKTLIVNDIEGPSKLIAGKEVVLSCTAPNFTETPSVTWLEKRGGDTKEIPESPGGDMEEEERLLETQQYVVTSEQDGLKYKSSLKFTPDIAKHKGVTLICRYTCGKEKIEKTFPCTPLYATPQLLQPITRSLFVSGELRYSVTLERFYPRDIAVRWTSVLGESEKGLTSTAILTDCLDGTHSACSEVEIPEDLLKDPKFRVRVSWEHGSQDTPEYKDLSIRDKEYLWTPVVEQIQTPQLFHNTPATLTCDISEYFPDNITVTWLRRNKDSEKISKKDSEEISKKNRKKSSGEIIKQDSKKKSEKISEKDSKKNNKNGNEEISKGDSGEVILEAEYLISKSVTQSKHTDNTYRSTATLTITPKLSVHQEAQYICWVEHPSLDKPIERWTGELVVKAKPQMVDPIEISKGRFSRVNFTLRLQMFYPQHVNITMTYQDKDGNSTIPYDSTLTRREDLTWDVTCVGHTSINAFKVAEFKVYITWKHESMEEPGTRTLTAKDLPWKPQVGEITIPTMHYGNPATLTCDISGYLFPDHLTVTWLKKEPGKDPILISSDGAYQKSHGKPKEKDKTFSCRSSLTFTPSVSKDQGSEFICRVDHPSLKRPIERSTGPINIWRPKVGEIVVPKMDDGKPATLICYISDYFQKDPTVTWIRKDPGKDSTPYRIVPSDSYRVSLTAKQEKNKLYSCQSCLTFTPSFSRDQGAEFRCVVQYSNLEEVIEKSTGPIDITPNSTSGTVNTSTSQ
ncbi:uncharacterized protein [Hyperolius riggenbachi]|uniref:uncharacterized protein isoform X2 n=1 Tax=Hyperolius riggenbachi TaxID=752182 RepID=UPI0035A26A66